MRTEIIGDKGTTLMKKLEFRILFVSLLGVLAACGGGDGGITFDESSGLKLTRHDEVPKDADPISGILTYKFDNKAQEPFNFDFAADKAGGFVAATNLNLAEKCNKDADCSIKIVWQNVKGVQYTSIQKNVVIGQNGLSKGSHDLLSVVDLFSSVAVTFGSKSLNPILQACSEYTLTAAADNIYYRAGNDLSLVKSDSVTDAVNIIAKKLLPNPETSVEIQIAAFPNTNNNPEEEHITKAVTLFATNDGGVWNCSFLPFLTLKYKDVEQPSSSEIDKSPPFIVSEVVATAEPAISKIQSKGELGFAWSLKSTDDTTGRKFFKVGSAGDTFVPPPVDLTSDLLELDEFCSRDSVDIAIEVSRTLPKGYFPDNDQPANLEISDTRIFKIGKDDMGTESSEEKLANSVCR